MADSMAQGAKELGRGIFQGVTGVVMEVRTVQCLLQAVRYTAQNAVQSTSLQARVQCLLQAVQ